MIPNAAGGGRLNVMRVHAGVSLFPIVLTTSLPPLGGPVFTYETWHNLFSRIQKIVKIFVTLSTDNQISVLVGPKIYVRSGS